MLESIYNLNGSKWFKSLSEKAFVLPTKKSEAPSVFSCFDPRFLGLVVLPFRPEAHIICGRAEKLLGIARLGRRL